MCPSTFFTYHTRTTFYIHTCHLQHAFHFYRHTIICSSFLLTLEPRYSYLIFTFIRFFLVAIIRFQLLLFRIVSYFSISRLLFRVVTVLYIVYFDLKSSVCVSYFISLLSLFNSYVYSIVCWLFYLCHEHFFCNTDEKKCFQAKSSD